MMLKTLVTLAVLRSNGGAAALLMWGLIALAGVLWAMSKG